jgi:hypothetical protein
MDRVWANQSRARWSVGGVLELYGALGRQGVGAFLEGSYRRVGASEMIMEESENLGRCPKRLALVNPEGFRCQKHTQKCLPRKLPFPEAIAKGCLWRKFPAKSCPPQKNTAFGDDIAGIFQRFLFSPNVSSSFARKWERSIGSSPYPLVFFGSPAAVYIVLR